MNRNILKNNIDLVLSFDDYHEGNVVIAERLIQLGLTATFFVELAAAGAKEQIKTLHGMGMKIGSHTLSHPADLKALPAEECRSELEVSKRMIEQLTGEPCTVLAYPRGRFNDDVVRLACQAGYLEARTTHVLRTQVDDLMRQGTTIHVYDGRKEYNGRPWVVMADFYLDHVKKHGGQFHLWGHSREIERDRQLEPLMAWLERATT